MAQVWKEVGQGLAPEGELSEGRVHTGVVRADINEPCKWRVVVAVKRGEGWWLETATWQGHRRHRELEAALQEAARYVRERVGGGRYQFYDRSEP